MDFEELDGIWTADERDEFRNLERGVELLPEMPIANSDDEGLDMSYVRNYASRNGPQNRSNFMDVDDINEKLNISPIGIQLSDDNEHTSAEKEMNKKDEEDPNMDHDLNKHLPALKKSKVIM